MCITATRESMSEAAVVATGEAPAPGPSVAAAGSSVA